MSFGLLNSALLLGLAGLVLPVLVHLLSRRNYDVVSWGAMQFLELSRNTKRRIRLEELLLLLLRMAMIALLVLALARPWFTGGPLARFTTPQARDIVLVIDGSYSMAWEGKTLTPHAAAIQKAQHFLDDLRPGDTVTVLDARERVRAVIDAPTRDFGLARERINALPPPTGSADLLEATAEALRALSRADNPSREIIVLTDGQARGWYLDDAPRWQALHDLREQSSIVPHIWLVDVVGRAEGDRTNFSLERLQPSREVTAVSLPVRVKTKLRYTGGKVPVQRKVYLEVNGQRLADATLQTPLLQPGGEFSVEFEHRFASAGSHVIGAVIDADNLPSDNRSDAVITVTEALPVLLVDGDPQNDPTRSETFFLDAALNVADSDAPLVRARVVDAQRFASPDVAGRRVVVLANVAQPTAPQADALIGFVERGGGLLLAPGGKVEAPTYNRLFLNGGLGVLPARLDDVQQVKANDVLGLRILDGSLSLPLVAPFRREHDGGLTDARFSRWWKLTPAPKPADGAPVGRVSRPVIDSPETAPLKELKRSGEHQETAYGLPAVAAPITAMKFDNGEPALLLGGYGRGHVGLLAFPLDSDWSTLPAKSDFVPFVHELLFYLAGSADPSRNVQVGEPLTLAVAADFPVAEYVFHGPGGVKGRPERAGDDEHPSLSFSDTQVPGVYTLAPLQAPPVGGAAAVRERFVVNFDRAESDLTPLDGKARELLTQNGRVQFAQSSADMQQQVSATGPKSEFWRYLILFLFGMLALELCVTRRYVRGGHTVNEDLD